MFIFEQLITESAGPSTLTLVGNTSSVSNTIAYPSGSAAGDIAFYFDKSETFLPPTTPSGYTTIVANNNASIGGLAAYKVLVSSDLSSNVVGSNASSNDAKYLLVVRPNNVVNSINPKSINSQATTADPTNQTITSSTAASVPLVSVFQLMGSAVVTSPTPPSGFTTITAAGNEHYVMYRLSNTGVTAANASYDQADHGSNCPQSFYTEIG